MKIQRLVALLAALMLAAPAVARTLTEAEAGGFSTDWANPSQLAGDVTGVSGTTAQNVFDIFRLAVPATDGAVRLSFSAGSRMDYSYAAGTVVKYAYAPFPWGWAGETLGQVDITWNDQADKSLNLLLDPSRGDTLYLALYNTHGAMDYNIAGFGAAVAAARSETPVAVPLPASAALMLAGLGGLGIVASRRSARRDARMARGRELR